MLMKFKERVIINSKPYELDKEDIIKVLKVTSPDNVRKFYIEIEGREYPITQALYSTLNLPKVYIKSNVVQVFLTKLGFEVKSKY